MTDIVLHDIDPALAERIRRIGAVRGWCLAETLLQILGQGLQAFERAPLVQLGDYETGALQAAIAALERVPNDPGFALIGRADAERASADPSDSDSSATFALE